MAILRPRSRGTEQRATSGGFPFLIVLGLWAFIVWALIYDQAMLNTIWNELRDLHIILQVILWFLLLPWVAAIAIWGADWALWVRALLISMIALFTIVGFAPRSRR